jgi:Outer membrane protein beta-barrel domain
MFRILSLVLLLSGSSAAQAGLLFEPYAGYAAGTVRVNGASAHPVASVQSLDSKGTIDGLVYGARAGWMFGRFVLGAEYQGVRGSEKLKGVDESVDWNSTAVYGMLGWRFLSGIRLFGAMTIQPYEATEETSPEATKFTGSSRKIVLGYEYRAPVAINLEYAEYTLSDYESGSNKGKVKDYYDKFNYSAVMITVSLPFELGSGRGHGGGR